MRVRAWHTKNNSFALNLNSLYTVLSSSFLISLYLATFFCMCPMHNQVTDDDGDGDSYKPTRPAMRMRIFCVINHH